MIYTTDNRTETFNDEEYWAVDIERYENAESALYDPYSTYDELWQDGYCLNPFADYDY